MYLSSLFACRGRHGLPDHQTIVLESQCVFSFSLLSLVRVLPRLGARICGTAVHSISADVTPFLFPQVSPPSLQVGRHPHLTAAIQATI